MKFIISALALGWSLPALALTYGFNPFPNSPEATELEGALQFLAERPGVHLILKMEPQAGIPGYPQSKKVVKAIESLRFYSSDEQGRKKIAAYLSRQDNVCAATTIRSLAKLLKDSGADFDQMSQKTYDSTPATEGKPSLAEFQKVSARVEFFALGGGPTGVNAEDAQNLIMFGKQPDGSPVSDDFDFAQVAYELPVRKLHFSVTSWTASDAGQYERFAVGTETVNEPINRKRMDDFYINHACGKAGAIIPLLLTKSGGRLRYL